MFLQITVEGVELVNQKIGDLSYAAQNPSEIMLQAAESAIMPNVEEASATIWQPRTGLYSSSNQVEAIATNAIRVSNVAPYSEPLEYGWVTKDGGFVESPGVVIPVTLESIPMFVEEIKDWLKSSLG